MKQEILNVVVGSLNPVKINAVHSALTSLFPDHQVECHGQHAPSLVADQPMSADETREGAINRVLYCQQQAESHQAADFYIAIEGGVDNFEYGPSTFAYVVIDNGERQSVGRSAILPLPGSVYQALQDGEELGDVMDQLFSTQNINQQGGAIGLLTNYLQTRQSVYTQALMLAMAPFLHSELYL